MDALVQSLLAPIQEANTPSQRLVGLLYLWMQGAANFKIYESGILDRAPAPGEPQKHIKLLGDLLDSARFFATQFESIDAGDLEAFGISQADFIATVHELGGSYLEWKEYGQV